MQVLCERCSLHGICLPLGLDEHGLELLERVVKHGRPMPRGAYLFEDGDPFVCLYAVRTGSLKTFMRRGADAEEIVGFHFPGELIGMDGIQTGSHSLAAVALETTSVCKLPYERLSELCKSVPELHRQLTLLFAAEISGAHLTLLSLRQHEAAGRLATFLISLSERAERRGLAAKEFVISMPFRDVANYLGVSAATLSRLLARFRQEGVLSVSKHICRIHDIRRLTAVAGDVVEDVASREPP